MADKMAFMRYFKWHPLFISQQTKSARLCPTQNRPKLISIFIPNWINIPSDKYLTSSNVMFIKFESYCIVLTVRLTVRHVCQTLSF